MTANPKPVDEVEILVLIDNQTDSLSGVPEGFTHEWVNLHGAGREQISGAGQCRANRGRHEGQSLRQGTRHGNQCKL